MKVGLARLRDSGELDKLVGARPFFERPGFLALAASIGVLTIGLVFVRWQTASTPSVLASSAAAFDKVLAVSSTPPMLRVRSDKYDAEIELPAERQALKLRLLPATPAGAAKYSVSLARLKDDGSTETVAAVKDLRPGRGWLHQCICGFRIAPAWPVSTDGDRREQRSAGLRRDFRHPRSTAGRGFECRTGVTPRTAASRIFLRSGMTPISPLAATQPVPRAVLLRI